MGKWATRFEACVNCGGTRHRHERRGLCRKCWALTRRLEQVQRWRFEQPETLRGFPGLSHDEAAVVPVRARCLTYNEGALELRRVREQQILGKVPLEGIDLEYQLRRLATRAHAHRGENYLFGLANNFDHDFRPAQRRFLFSVLYAIEEDVRSLSLAEMLVQR